MKKQTGFLDARDYASIFGIICALLAVGGWIANIIKLIGMLNGSLTTMFIARIVGVFAAPVGAVLGYF